MEKINIALDGPSRSTPLKNKIAIALDGPSRGTPLKNNIVIALDGPSRGTPLKNKITIALDGPSGAGKSTLAKKTAQHFGLIYVDTGALYRCIGLFVYRSKISSKDIDGIRALLPSIILEMKYDEAGVQRMLLCGEDVTEIIRTPEISVYASDVSAIPDVRNHLLEMQRDMAARYDVVMDGRDIGTVVLPDAGLKIFITADVEVRAKRRYLELLETNNKTKYDDVLNAMIIRDENDSKRETAPLKAADDAIVLDTSNLDFENSFITICNLVTGRFGK